MISDEQGQEWVLRKLYEGYKFAEISYYNIYFWKNKEKSGHLFIPRINVNCTCFEVSDQMINIEEYLGIVDWSKVEVDTPILVRDFGAAKWQKRYFAYFENGRVYTWCGGATSWSSNGCKDTMSWRHAKLADEGGL